MYMCIHVCIDIFYIIYIIFTFIVYVRPPWRRAPSVLYEMATYCLQRPWRRRAPSAGRLEALMQFFADTLRCFDQHSLLPGPQPSGQFTQKPSVCLLEVISGFIFYFIFVMAALCIYVLF